VPDVGHQRGDTRRIDGRLRLVTAPSLKVTVPTDPINASRGAPLRGCPGARGRCAARGRSLRAASRRLIAARDAGDLVSLAEQGGADRLRGPSRFPPAPPARLCSKARRSALSSEWDGGRLASGPISGTVRGHPPALRGDHLLDQPKSRPGRAGYRPPGGAQPAGRVHVRRDPGDVRAMSRSSRRTGSPERVRVVLTHPSVRAAFSSRAWSRGLSRR